MPLIIIKTFEGKPKELRKKWMEAVTRVSMEVTGIENPSAFNVIIEEIPEENWGIGGVRASDRD